MRFLEEDFKPGAKNESVKKSGVRRPERETVGTGGCKPGAPVVSSKRIPARVSDPTTTQGRSLPRDASLANRHTSIPAGYHGSLTLVAKTPPFRCFGQKKEAEIGYTFGPAAAISDGASAAFSWEIAHEHPG